MKQRESERKERKVNEQREGEDSKRNKEECEKRSEGGDRCEGTKMKQLKKII